MADYLAVALGSVGSTLLAYAGTREALAQLAARRPHGEGRFGEDVFGGGVGPRMHRVLSVATAVRLLPPDRKLTLTDRERDAWCFVVGTALLAAAWAAGGFSR